MLRVFGYYVSKVFLFLGIWESALFFASLYLGIFLRFNTFGDPEGLPDSTSITITSAVFALVMMLSMMSMGLYQRGFQERASGFVVRLGLSFLLGTALMALIFYAFPVTFVGRGVLGFSQVIAFVGVALTRSLFVRRAAVESRKRRVLVLGVGVNASRIDELATSDPRVGFFVVGYVPLKDSHQLIDEYKRIKHDRPLLDVVFEKDVDEIVIAVDDRRRKLPVDEILDCKMSGFEVLDLLTFFEKENAVINIDMLHPSWIFFSSGFHIGLTGLYGKRLFDVLISLLMLTVASPLMLLVALASLIESRGKDPILFHQVRVGQNGKLFRLHKFRSMRVDAEADGVARWASRNDHRVTRLGTFLRKTRLDELPQIFNVLKGQMSLVGPRPERPEFVEKLAKTIPFYSERHRVKPGVTGWAQMLYPYGASEDDARHKLEYDLYYVKHAGLFLDLIILMQTVEVVLLGKGAR